MFEFKVLFDWIFKCEDRVAPGTRIADVKMFGFKVGPEGTRSPETFITSSARNGGNLVDCFDVGVDMIRIRCLKVTLGASKHSASVHCTDMSMQGSLISIFLPTMGANMWPSFVFVPDVGRVTAEGAKLLWTHLASSFGNVTMWTSQMKRKIFDLGLTTSLGTLYSWHLLVLGLDVFLEIRLFVKSLVTGFTCQTWCHGERVVRRTDMNEDLSLLTYNNETWIPTWKWIKSVYSHREYPWSGI